LVAHLAIYWAIITMGLAIDLQRWRYRPT